MESSNSETSLGASLHDVYNLPHLKEVGDQSWRERARCKGLPVDLFFPRKQDANTNFILVANARLVCAGCQVRKECLRFAVDNVITHGMYGGVMPRDRRFSNLAYPNGEMPFTQVVSDFKKANQLNPKRGIPKSMYPELARSINKTLAEVQEMMKAPDLHLLISGS